MASKPNTPSSRENIYSAWYNFKNLSIGREIKGTIYNIGVFVGISALVLFIFVLFPFLKPLLWALLIGAVVYPLKRKISFSMKAWFDNLEESDGNLFINIAATPFHTLDSLGETLGTFIKNHKHLLLGGIGALAVTRLLVEYAPRKLICWVWRAIIFTHSHITTILSQLSATLVIGFLIAYLTTVVFFWKQTNHNSFMIFGQSLWLVLVAYICSFLGPLQVPVFLAIITYAIAGTIYNYKMQDDKSESSQNVTFLERVKGLIEVQKIKPSKEILNKSTESSSSSKSQLDAPIEDDADLEDLPLPSDTFFKILFLACLATVVFRNMWLLFFSAIPMFIHFFKEILLSTGTIQFVKEKSAETKIALKKWIAERYTAVLPICLPGVLMLNQKVHAYIRDNLRASIDLMSSIVVIVLMILIVISTSIFFSVQIYSEGIAVAQLGHEVVNKAFIHKPELKDMFPENTFDNIIDNAHEYGRKGIETYIDDMLRETDTQQAKQLKEQILTAWDRLVQNMLERGNGSDEIIGPKMGFGLKDSIEEIVDNPAAKQGIIAWAKSNVGMLKDVMDSVIIILRKNMAVLGTVLGSIFSVLLGGGHAVITFLVDTIIFFTALFYLLCSSQEQYTPLVFVTTLGFASGPRIAEAIEGSIAGVIIATAKIALFHGLFTWLTHTVFNVSVVYLPAVMATVFAAAPFLGTYWCAVPAFFDLWLAQDRFWTAVLLISLHILIPSSVDAAVYAEIKSAGHPYLTGLSIAGGLYWMGLQGAVLGPLLLCLLVMLVELTVKAIKESPSTVNPPLVEMK